jgi:hypothetical protein
MNRRGLRERSKSPPTLPAGSALCGYVALLMDIPSFAELRSLVAAFVSGVMEADKSDH